MLAYLEKDFSVIPIGRDKKPLIPTWKEYQTKHAAKEEVAEWCKALKPVGIGIVTGKISGIAVLDIDVGADTSGLELPPTPSVNTGGGGSHHYFKLPAGVLLQSSNGFRHKMDFKAEGGYVIAPPSLHKSGKRYEWAVAPEDADFAEIPSWLKQEIESRGGAQKDWSSITKGVAEGGRNSSAASYIGKLLQSLPEVDWESVAWASAIAWNKQNKPPLPEKELRSVFDSIAMAEKKGKEEKPEDKSYPAKLVKLVLSTGGLLFHDQSGDGYIALNNNGAETLRLKSKQFSHWLAKLSWEEYGKPLRGEDTRTVLGTLGGLAVFNGEEYPLCVRVARSEGAIWYDLGKSAVKISKEGWEVVDNPPILFRRYPHQEAQVMPERGGSLAQVLEFINIKNESEQLLIMVWCVSGLIPSIPHPFPIFHGPQGSAKSTCGAVFKQLLDPSQLKQSSPPDNLREFIQVGSHHWFLPIDNLSSLYEWLSDALCRACTGEGFSKRELYSDDDDVVYSFQNIGSLNGINLVVEKPDLMERCVIFGLQKVEKVENLASFNERFKQAKPLILGAMFDMLVGALQRVDSVPTESQFRMSDFVRWGCAISEALGHSAEDFIRAYQSNIGLQHQEAVDASPVAQAIEVLMEDRDEWHGTPTDLYNELETIAEKQHLDKKAKTWPNAASWMWRRIAPIASNLLARGIKVDRSTEGKERVVILTKLTGNVVDTVDGIGDPENTLELDDSTTSDAVSDAVDKEGQETLGFGSTTASTAFPDDGTGGGWGD